MPSMFKKVSCWPANDASGRSSAVALERTANDRPASVPTSCSYACRISRSRSAGNGCATTASRICRPTAASRWTSSVSNPLSRSVICPANPVSPMNRW